MFSFVGPNSPRSFIARGSRRHSEGAQLGFAFAKFRFRMFEKLYFSFELFCCFIVFILFQAASAFKPAIAGLQDVKGITLDIANKIYVSDGPGYSLATDFQKKAVDIFQSEIENINFIESAKAASTINAWVFIVIC